MFVCAEQFAKIQQKKTMEEKEILRVSFRLILNFQPVPILLNNQI